MAITVTCQCGKKLGVKDEMAGKKVRCPACQTVLTVPGGAEEMPPPELAAEEEAPAPKRTTRTVSNGNAAGEPKSKKTLYFIIGGVAGVLLLGCCCLGGVGSWFLFLRGPSGMDAKIIGRWAPDLEAQKKNNPKNESFAGTIEFKSDGGVIDGTPMSPILLGKWKTLSSKSDTNTLTVELKDSSNTKKLDIKVLDNDHLRITPDGGPGEFYFKRDSSK